MPIENIKTKACVAAKILFSVFLVLFVFFGFSGASVPDSPAEIETIAAEVPVPEEKRTAAEAPWYVYAAGFALGGFLPILPVVAARRLR